MKNTKASLRWSVDPDDMTSEERLEALADVLAEGFLYLAEKGLLDDVMGKGGEAGPEEFARKGAKSPCFPSEQRISFLPDDGWAKANDLKRPA